MNEASCISDYVNIKAANKMKLRDVSVFQGLHCICMTLQCCKDLSLISYLTLSPPVDVNVAVL